tara:strand:+ start:307 stop:1131 length:825 start_codon:yes stop_codon:yes gene_type:complete
MNRIATIILNRNLPIPTDNLYEHILEYDGDITDIYVLEAGSNKNKLSKYCTWHANTQEIKEQGLRYPRGMNYALLKLRDSSKWNQYDAFMLLSNDIEFSKKKNINNLYKILKEREEIGILSPCSKVWGDRFLLSKKKTRYFWYIQSHAFMLRREFIENIEEKEFPNYINYLFDGNNFRGYMSEHDLIAKAYANDWTAAITSEVFAEENETYLLTKSDLIKTENYELSKLLFLEEGKKWAKRKFGFNSHWQMQQHVKLLYDKYFEYHPEHIYYKI